MDRDPIARINHVALSVPAECIDAAGRGELLDFYGDVFGWTEMPGMARDGELLVLRAGSNEQFVYLVADPNPMRCPGTDHFGLSVASPDILRDMAARARARAVDDPGVELTEIGVQDFQVLKLHNFYVRYRIPMSVEVQCFEWSDGVGPESLPESGGR